MALYRAGDCKASAEALLKATQISERGNGCELFFLAMAHWQLGHEVQARTWYYRAVECMKQDQPENVESKRFRAEAAALLCVNDLPGDVIVRP